LRSQERRLVCAICSQVEQVVAGKGTASTGVLQLSLARMKLLLKRRRLREAEEMAYRILMECRGVEREVSSDESAET